MKQFNKSFLAILLSLLVLLGSGQFTIGKMICTDNGNASYSLGKAKDCCETKGVKYKAFERACCDLINITYLLDDFSISKKTNIAAQTFDLFHLPSCYFPFPVYQSNIAFNSLRTYPPPGTTEPIYLFRSLLL